MVTMIPGKVTNTGNVNLSSVDNFRKEIIELFVLKAVKISDFFSKIHLLN